MNQPGRANKKYKQLYKIRPRFDNINNACTKLYRSPEYLILKKGSVCSSKQNVISHKHTRTRTQSTSSNSYVQLILHTLQGIKRRRENVWLVHSGQCQQSKFPNDNIGRSIQQMLVSH